MHPSTSSNRSPDPDLVTSGGDRTPRLTRRTLLGRLLAAGAAIAGTSLAAACQQPTSTQPAAPAPKPTEAPPVAKTEAKPTEAAKPAAKPTEAAKPAAEAKPAATTAPAAKPAASDARVVVAQAVDVTTLDPNTDTLITNRNVQLNMFDTLIERDHQMQFKPGLAESWQNVDPTTWRFTLRKGVKFHDGSPFTAQDVKYSVDRIKGPVGSLDLKSKMTLYVDAVSEVQVVDDYTVVMKTKEPYPLFETRFSATPIVSKAAVEKVGLEEFAKQPVGTGPFRFVEWQKDQRVVMERFDEHWRGGAGIKTLVFRPITEPSVRVSELQTGGIDVGVRVPVDSIGQLESGGIAVKGVPSVRVLHGMMDMSKKPFDDKRVRQAMNYAVDVDAIIKSLLRGRAFRSTQPVDPATFGYDPDIQPYPYDPARAKQLLTEAGYPNGFEVELGAQTDQKQIAEVIAASLSQVGVRASIVMDEPSVHIRKVVDKKNQPLFLFSWGSSTFDADGTTYSLMRTGQLYSVTSLPALDALVDRAHTILDQQERKKLYSEAHRLIREEAPIIFLWQLEDLYGVRSRVNWNPRPDEMLWFYDATAS